MTKETAMIYKSFGQRVEVNVRYYLGGVVELFELLGALILCLGGLFVLGVLFVVVVKMLSGEYT